MQVFRLERVAGAIQGILDVAERGVDSFGGGLRWRGCQQKPDTVRLTRLRRRLLASHQPEHGHPFTGICNDHCAIAIALCV